MERMKREREGVKEKEEELEVIREAVERERRRAEEMEGGMREAETVKVEYLARVEQIEGILSNLQIGLDPDANTLSKLQSDLSECLRFPLSMSTLESSLTSNTQMIRDLDLMVENKLKYNQAWQEERV